MKSLTYQSSSYPTLSQLIEITASDYNKLRHLMTERGELEKFVNWQKSKFIRIFGGAYIPLRNDYNPSKFKSGTHRTSKGLRFGHENLLLNRLE